VDLREEYLVREKGGLLSGQPTGFAALDSLSDGQQPGELWVFGAYTGQGKTTVGDTLVWTTRGIVPISSYDAGQDGFTPISEQVRLHDLTVQATQIYRCKDEPTIRLHMKSGRVLGGAYTHPVFVGENGVWFWKKLSEFKVGDFIPVFLGSYPEPVEVDKDMLFDVEVLGLMVGDGCYTENMFKLNTAQVLVGSQDWDWFKEWPRFKKSGSINRGSRKGDLRIFGGGWILDFLKDWGVGPGDSHSKTVPSRITNLPKVYQAAFIRGLWRADGHCGSQSVEITLASELLVKQLQEMLRNLGIHSSVSSCNKKDGTGSGFVGKYWRLNINGHRNVRAFRDVVGWKGDGDFCMGRHNFRSERSYVPVVNGALKSLRKQIRAPRGSKYESVKRVLYYILKGDRNLTRKNLCWILDSVEELGLDVRYLRPFTREDIIWDRVESIEYSVETLYDFTVPSTGCFTGNGFVQHNSFLLQNIAYNRRIKYGLRGAFFSTEQQVAQVKRRLCIRHSKDPKFGLGEGLSYTDVKRARLDDRERKIWLDEVIPDWESGNYPSLHVVSVPARATLGSIFRRAEMMHHEEPLDFIIIDYLSQLRPSFGGVGVERQVLSELIIEAKSAALSFGGTSGIPVLTAAQTNPVSWERAQEIGKYPLRSVADSAEAERSADLLAFLLRREQEIEQKVVKVNVAKYRDGEGQVEFMLEEDYAHSFLGNKDVPDSENSFFSLEV